MNRRDLLKQAAKTAPIIATIPCGAIAATGSTHACLADPVKADPATPTADQLVRVRATCADWRRGRRIRKVFDIPLKGLYKANGEVFYPTGWRKVSEDEEVHLMVFYERSEDYSSLSLAGVYPMAGSDVRTAGISGSCMISVMPNLTTEVL